MRVVANFGHALSSPSQSWLVQRLGVFEYVHVRMRVDFHQDVASQVSDAVSEVDRILASRGASLDGSEVYVVLPGTSESAVVLIAEVYGRTGLLPYLIHFRRVEGLYVAYAICNLTNVRTRSRGFRRPQQWTPVFEAHGEPQS